MPIFSLPKPQATPITTKIKKKVEKCTSCLDALEIFGNDLSYSFPSLTLSQILMSKTFGYLKSRRKSMKCIIYLFFNRNLIFSKGFWNSKNTSLFSIRYWLCWLSIFSLLNPHQTLKDNAYVLVRCKRDLLRSFWLCLIGSKFIVYGANRAWNLLWSFPLLNLF